MDQPIGIRLPKDIIKKIENLSKKSSEDRSTILRKLIVAGYSEKIKEKSAEDYMGGRITLSEAASNADITIWEMEEYLISKGFKSQFSIDNLDKEMQLLNKK